jgi:hypothetical protein
MAHLVRWRFRAPTGGAGASLLLLRLTAPRHHFRPTDEDTWIDAKNPAEQNKNGSSRNRVGEVRV